MQPSNERDVSVLFNEPKLLKLTVVAGGAPDLHGFSALQRAEIAEINRRRAGLSDYVRVSVLFNEPKLLKFAYLLDTRSHL